MPISVRDDPGRRCRYGTQASESGPRAETEPVYKMKLGAEAFGHSFLWVFICKGILLMGMWNNEKSVTLFKFGTFLCC